MTGETWCAVRDELKAKVGPNNFAAWIEPLEFADMQEGVLTFAVPSNFMGNWVDRYFRETILQEINMKGHRVARLQYRLRDAADVPAERADKSAKPVATSTNGASSAPDKMSSRPGLSETGAKLDERFTFSSFVVGKPNELAHAAARRVAEGGPVSFNPFFMHGGVGLGKTHLMHAMAWELRERRPDLRVLYLSAEKFMYRFIQALRDRDMMNFKELFRSVDVLMVDDIQFIAGKDSTQEEFFHTFNALVDQGKQVILSADNAPGDIDGLEHRIVSRLQSGLVADVHPTSYELRLGILQSKCAYFGAQFEGVTIGDGVLELLANRIDSNVRVLEGALTRLYAHGSFLRREVDIDLAQECLRDLLRQADVRVSVDDIQRKVADHYNIKLADLLGPKRNRQFARPRQMAMYLSKQMTQRSLPDIARRFGKRDHTTIMHGIRKIEQLRVEDRQIEEDFVMLKRALGGA